MFSGKTGIAKYSWNRGFYVAKKEFYQMFFNLISGHRFPGINAMCCNSVIWMIGRG